MSGNQPGRRPKKNAPAAQKSRNKGRGGTKRNKKRSRSKSKRSAIDPKRPVWENPSGESELQTIVGSVRPAQNPTALVRSLGEPPLGKYASTAHHYYEAVYDKAQHYAVAIAAANGLLVVDDDGYNGNTGSGNTGSGNTGSGNTGSGNTDGNAGDVDR